MSSLRMPRLRLKWFARLIFTLLGTVGTTVGAAETTPVLSASAAVRERMLRMTEYFDTMLPGVLQEHNLTLHATPKFSDLRDNEFIRFPFELRYGATARWEFSGGLTPFMP